MPSDLSSREGSLLPGSASRRRSRSAPPPPIKWTRVVLLLILVAAYSTFALVRRPQLPPWSTLEWYKHRNDPVVKHRPAFKNVPRYSPQHRYRPAASPVLKKVGKDGKINHHGDYHLV